MVFLECCEVILRFSKVVMVVILRKVDLTDLRQ